MIRQNTLRSSEKDQSSVKDVGGWSLWMASVVCDAIPKRLGWMTCRR